MSSYSEGQIHQLANSLEKAGFTAGDITRLGQSPDLCDHRGALLGSHEITPISNAIDLESSCKLPFPAAKLVSHCGKGFVRIEKINDGLYLDGKKVGIFLLLTRRVEWILGYEICVKIEEKSEYHVSAKVLDYLMDSPLLWPESWKKDKEGDVMDIFFLGDIYQKPLPSERFYVRYGRWANGKVCSGNQLLDHCWAGPSTVVFLEG